MYNTLEQTKKIDGLTIGSVSLVKANETDIANGLAVWIDNKPYKVELSFYDSLAETKIGEEPDAIQ